MKRFGFFLAILAPFTSVPAVTAKDLSSMYSASHVAAEYARVNSVMNRLYSQAIQPSLTSGELQRLAGLTIDTPLYGTNRDPLTDFYSKQRTVTLSVFGLLFLEDLSTAWAWLSTNGYRPDVVQDYVTMLRYKPASGFEGGRYPAPLGALAVPANALANPKVSDTSLRIRNEAWAFVLGHELAHVYYNHRGYDGVAPEQARGNEEAADRFSFEIFRRTSTAPLGGMLFFLAAAYYYPNRGDASSDAEWNLVLQQQTHPLTGHRLAALAEEFNQAAADVARLKPSDAVVFRFMAGQFLEFGKDLSDTELQTAMRNRALRTSPITLRQGR
jgi:hypothetical protein